MKTARGGGEQKLYLGLRPCRVPPCEDGSSAFCSVFAAAVVSMSGGDKHGGLTCKSHVSQPAELWHEYIFHLNASPPTQQRRIVNIS